jgi:hypothetical protein
MDSKLSDENARRLKDLAKRMFSPSISYKDRLPILMLYSEESLSQSKIEQDVSSSDSVRACTSLRYHHRQPA